MKSGKWFGQSVNTLSELLRNPGKGTLGSQNSKKFPKGNRSVFIQDRRSWIRGLLVDMSILNSTN